ncbi:MAG: SHOCT domain-containing protein [Chromatiaceae bacterium]|nr:MAG: SHOCT domain-containing protein [Chromatiaceae bacterium]
MQQLSPQGQQIVQELAARHGFSTDAVAHMLLAVLHGNGSMAQFSHPEFGGSGQWMRGGMLMLGDMFNHALQGRVDALCNELAGLLASQPGLLQSGSFQSQSQGGSGRQQQTSGGVQGHSSLFIPDPADHWWPTDLGSPAATGSQNNVKYAYFPAARRLAVNSDGSVWVYDSLDHQIGGFSQQQGPGGSISFSSQYGEVDLNRLPVVLRDGQPVNTPDRASQPPAAGGPNPGQAAPGHPAGDSTALAPAEVDVFTAIERLAELQARGILTAEEFANKKAELLSRL